MRKIWLLSMFLFLYGCTQQPVERASLPEDNFLVIAHRGASAYVTAHTLAAYELAIQMGAPYIEIDLQMTKDGKLVALHDSVLTINDAQRAVSDVTLNEIQQYSPVNESPQSVYASPGANDLRIVDLPEILLNLGDNINYYIELKSPNFYPGIEEELLKLLEEHQLINGEGTNPRVIIQSFDEDSLRKVFAMEPSIPLVKLYKLKKDENISKKELKKLMQYASGVGVNVEAVTREMIESLQSTDLHVHPYTINDEETMRHLKKLGVNGFSTDRPDVGMRVKNE